MSYIADKNNELNILSKYCGKEQEFNLKNSKDFLHNKEKLIKFREKYGYSFDYSGKTESQAITMLINYNTVCHFNIWAYRIEKRKKFGSTKIRERIKQEKGLE